MILGGGLNRIGQGIEFDYCCVHASLALKELGFETIIVNCNPETVSTDYDTSDKLYFEPLTLEDVLSIYNKEKPLGVIAQFGGQTPLNLASELEKNGVKILGTPPSVIDLAENARLVPLHDGQAGHPHAGSRYGYNGRGSACHRRQNRLPCHGASILCAWRTRYGSRL